MNKITKQDFIGLIDLYKGDYEIYIRFEKQMHIIDICDSERSWLFTSIYELGEYNYIYSMKINKLLMDKIKKEQLL